MSFNLENIVRGNIKQLVAYSSARDEYKGSKGVFLDANENAFGSPLVINYNRYPDPLQLDVKSKISSLKNISIENIFLGNGSDEAIDILFRAFCVPAKDNVIVCPPTYGMYEVSANINNIDILKVPLVAEIFQLDTATILNAITENTKLIFICCPNNPTGNGVKWDDIKIILESFKGIVVVDEAYIDFAGYGSLIPQLPNYKNLVILQTFSKGWGLAGLRVGMAFASDEIVTIFNKIKPPYNINAVSQQLLLEALDNRSQVDEWIKEIISERKKVSQELSKLSCVKKVYPSEANFILVKTENAKKVYDFLITQKIIVRDRSNVTLCNDCLRITIGTKEENKQLMNSLTQYNL
ncbi:MAG: histidinol-phosphate transaminase [Bacteroidota bacterium]